MKGNKLFMRVVETERFILRKVELDDVKSIYNILSDKDVILNLNMEIHENIEDTYKLLDDYFEGLSKNTKFPYAIVDKNSNEFIGVFLIKLDLYDEDCFEFTIYLDKRYWGKGIYTEVLTYMTEVAFDDIHTGNFRGFVMERNVASSRVLEKCGFELEKIFEVPGIEGKIISYLMTSQNYRR